MMRWYSHGTPDATHLLQLACPSHRIFLCSHKNQVGISQLSGLYDDTTLEGILTCCGIGCRQC